MLVPLNPASTTDESVEDTNAPFSLNKHLYPSILCSPLTAIPLASKK